MDAMHSEDGPQTFRMIARLFMGIGVAGVIGLTFIAPWLMRLLTTPDYFSAWKMTGILAWQSLFYGFFLVGSAGIWKAEKTWITSLLMIGAALFNVFLNYLLVPPYAGLGAALATVITYFLWMMTSIILSEHFWLVGFRMRVLLFQVAVGCLVTLWLIVSDKRSTLEFSGAFASFLLMIISSLEKKDWLKIKRKVDALLEKNN